MDIDRYTDPLKRTPAMLRAAVTGLSEAWLDAKHSEDTVSPREAVAHLVLVEREWGWVYRIKRLLDPAHVEDGVEVDETAYAREHSIEELLTEFERVRENSLEGLGLLNLTAEDLLKSSHDPEFGMESVQNQLAGWVAHDLYHLGQIFKSYASLYKEEIGPYQEHLNLPHFN